jgi:hypothetical protein
MDPPNRARTDLVAGEARDGKTLALVLLIKLLKFAVLRGEAERGVTSWSEGRESGIDVVNPC